MEQATIRGRRGLSVEDVRAALSAWAAAEGGMLRMDRPLRAMTGGRHFHVAAPDPGSGTLEVNFEPATGRDSPRVLVYAREHWRGAWAGGAQLRLVEHLAAELGA